MVNPSLPETDNKRILTNVHKKGTFGADSSPHLKKSQESESIADDDSYFLDFKESDTPDRRQSSRGIGGTDSEEDKRLRRFGSGRLQFNRNSSKEPSLKQQQ